MAAHVSLSHVRCYTMGWSGDVSSYLHHVNHCHISLNSHFTSSVWLAQIRIAFGKCYLSMPGGSTECYFPFRNKSLFFASIPSAVVGLKWRSIDFWCNGEQWAMALLSAYVCPLCLLCDQGSTFRLFTFLPLFSSLRFNDTASVWYLFTCLCITSVQ